ncbi:hypothetical protein GMOD_00003743 [Pyrenophora seminiperda CCB06]|uniref:Uncharacterized protein n=1 Tax=Pyrenophora seminiperda CCB06 TaxID=1302712 RepID=A0A3M7ML12_9PLEO|nr:hypothetical protein GMOD_00003743 [Pyrenophora seminiperda CCB06]
MVAGALGPGGGKWASKPLRIWRIGSAWQCLDAGSVLRRGQERLLYLHMYCMQHADAEKLPCGLISVWALDVLPMCELKPSVTSRVAERLSGW